MKKILKLIAILLVSLNANCQTLPLLSPEEVNNGGYYKDLNDVFLFWVDTWKGQVNNKEYTFQFVKFTEHQTTYPSGNYHYRDELMGKFKVVDLATGNILYNDLNITNFGDYKINFLSHNIYNGYSFAYTDIESKCYNKADFKLIKDPNNPNQIQYTSFEYYNYLKIDCPFANQQDIPMFLPKVDLVLIRQ
jgi:hypothetical protein